MTSPAADEPQSTRKAPKEHQYAKPPIGFEIEEIADGLDQAWEIGFLPNGKVLISQRPGKFALLSSYQPGAKVTTLKPELKDVYVKAEAGLLGLVVHPDFEQTRQFTACQTHTEKGKIHDIRLVTWRLSEDEKKVEKVKDLITGLPANENGMHVGCRLTLAPDGALLIGTGDGWVSEPPQDKTNLGGKLLRVDLKTGEGLPDNPFADSDNENERRISSYGHRNVQGVAIQPGTGAVYTSEHGPDKDDEINLNQHGENYGYDPRREGEDAEDYWDTAPMTDKKRFPDAVDAVWATGKPTEAMGTTRFIEGKRWGPLDGALIALCLKGSKMLIFTLDKDGKVTNVAKPPEFDQAYGRLRAAQMGPDGALYVTTSNGETDKFLRVTPKK